MNAIKLDERAKLIEDMKAYLDSAPYIINQRVRLERALQGLSDSLISLIYKNLDSSIEDVSLRGTRLDDEKGEKQLTIFDISLSEMAQQMIASKNEKYKNKTISQPSDISMEVDVYSKVKNQEITEAYSTIKDKETVIESKLLSSEELEKILPALNECCLDTMNMSFTQALSNENALKFSAPEIRKHLDAIKEIMEEPDRIINETLSSFDELQQLKANQSLLSKIRVKAADLFKSAGNLAGKALISGIATVRGEKALDSETKTNPYKADPAKPSLSVIAKAFTEKLHELGNRFVDLCKDENREASYVELTSQSLEIINEIIEDTGKTAEAHGLKRFVPHLKQSALLSSSDKLLDIRSNLEVRITQCQKLIAEETSLLPDAVFAKNISLIESLTSFEQGCNICGQTLGIVTAEHLDTQKAETRAIEKNEPEGSLAYYQKATRLSQKTVDRMTEIKDYFNEAKGIIDTFNAKKEINAEDAMVYLNSQSSRLNTISEALSGKAITTFIQGRESPNFYDPKNPSDNAERKLFIGLETAVASLQTDISKINQCLDLHHDMLARGAAYLNSHADARAAGVKMIEAAALAGKEKISVIEKTVDECKSLINKTDSRLNTNTKSMAENDRHSIKSALNHLFARQDKTKDVEASKPKHKIRSGGFEMA